MNQVFQNFVLVTNQRPHIVTTPWKCPNLKKMKRFETIAHHTAMDNHRHGEWFHFKNTREIEQLVESISEYA